MGRDPWDPCQRAYIEGIKSYYATKTLQTMERGFRTIHKAFLETLTELGGNIGERNAASQITAVSKPGPELLLGKDHRGGRLIPTR